MTNMWNVSDRLPWQIMKNGEHLAIFSLEHLCIALLPWQKRKDTISPQKYGRSPITSTLVFGKLIFEG